MKIIISGLHTDLTPIIEEYVYKRLAPLDKFVKDDQAQCKVELMKTTAHHRSGDIYRAEAHITGAGPDIYAEAERDDLYSAVDTLRDELERILSSQKDKRITLFRKGAQKIKNFLKK